VQFRARVCLLLDLVVQYMLPAKVEFTKGLSSDIEILSDECTLYSKLRSKYVKDEHYGGNPEGEKLGTW